MSLWNTEQSCLSLETLQQKEVKYDLKYDKRITCTRISWWAAKATGGGGEEGVVIKLVWNLTYTYEKECRLIKILQLLVYVLNYIMKIILEDIRKLPSPIQLQWNLPEIHENCLISGICPTTSKAVETVINH